MSIGPLPVFFLAKTLYASKHNWKRLVIILLGLVLLPLRISNVG